MESSSDSTKDSINEGGVWLGGGIRAHNADTDTALVSNQLGITMDVDIKKSE